MTDQRITVRTHDSVARFRNAYLGPEGFALPMPIPYVGLVVWFGALIGVVIIESITGATKSPMLLLEAVIAAGIAYGLMLGVDHERPLTAVLVGAWRGATAHPYTSTAPRGVTPTVRRRLPITREPIA